MIMESPIRKLQKRNDYQRYKLFRKIKRKKKAAREQEQNIAEKELRKKLKLPKFNDANKTRNTEAETTLKGLGIPIQIQQESIPKQIRVISNDGYQMETPQYFDENGNTITKDDNGEYHSTTLKLPEIIVSTKDPRSVFDKSRQADIARGYENQYFDGNIMEPIIKMIDPTGISNYKDAYNAINYFLENKNLGSFTNAAFSTFGAMPLVGKFKYLGKLNDAIDAIPFIKTYTNVTNNLNPVSKGIKYVVDSYNNKKIYNKVGNFFKKFMDEDYGKLNKTYESIVKSINQPINSTNLRNFLFQSGRMYNSMPYAPVLDYAMHNSGGIVGKLFGDKYTGSYKYNNDKNNSNFFSGQNVGNYDMINEKLYGSEGKDTFNINGNTIIGRKIDKPMIPANKITMNSNLKDKIDDVILNNKVIGISLDDAITSLYNKNKDPKHGVVNKELIDAGRVTIKPYKKDGKYKIKIIDLPGWDFSNLQNGNPIQKFAGNFIESIIRSKINTNQNPTPIVVQDNIDLDFNNDFDDWFNPIFHNSGKDIHIDKNKRGTFTRAAKAHGMGVQEFAHKVLSAPKGKYSSNMRKKANFARNASKFKH